MRARNIMSTTAGIALFWGVCAAAPSEPSKELLKDSAPTAPPAPAAGAKPQAKPQPKARVPFPYDGTAGSMLTKLLAARDNDPLRYLASDMGHIVTDLSAYHTDKPVQVKQEKVVARLDELIKMLEQSCKSGSGGGANPTKPLNDSILAKGPGGQGAMIDPRQGEKQWASLPAKQREQILQSQTEGFPPGYERILQSYYQRLSEEKVNAETAPAAGATGAQ
jgi:hypothetical protein